MPNSNSLIDQVKYILPVVAAIVVMAGAWYEVKGDQRELALKLQAVVSVDNAQNDKISQLTELSAQMRVLNTTIKTFSAKLDKLDSIGDRVLVVEGSTNRLGIRLTQLERSRVAWESRVIPLDERQNNLIEQLEEKFTRLERQLDRLQELLPRQRSDNAINHKQTLIR